MLKKKPLALMALVLSLFMIAAACGGDDSSGSGGTTTTAAEGSVDYSSLSGSIKGSGSSFTDAYMQGSIDGFSEKSDLEVTYNAVGSGQGKKDFGSNVTNFAGTDSLVKDGDGPAAGSFLYTPTVAAPITISYNLDGVDKLQLSADTLAGIFQATITKWDDDAIKAENPDADLPSEDIIVVHRSDGSGTTSNFTKYLDAASEDWTLGGGDTVAWPTSTQGAEKNGGVAQLVKDNPGAVGYVDLSDAEASGLSFASIKNADGKYVAPTIEGAAAVAGAEVQPDLTYNPLNAAGADVYPITSPTYVLVRTSYADQATVDNVVGFVTYLLTDGQSQAADLGYASIPSSLAEQALAQLDKITVG